MLLALLPPLQAGLLDRDSAVASFEQECQKLREKLEVNTKEFERLVGGLKEELLQMQEQKTDLEVRNVLQAKGCTTYPSMQQYILCIYM